MNGSERGKIHYEVKHGFHIQCLPIFGHQTLMVTTKSSEVPDILVNIVLNIHSLDGENPFP